MPPYTFLNRPAAKALYSALTEDPFYITLEQQSRHSGHDAKESMLRYYDFALKEAGEYGRLVFTPDRQSGASVWATPLDQIKEEDLSRQKKDFILEHLGTNSLDAYAKIVAFMSEQSQGSVNQKAWYLSILGVSPSCQGQGLGKALMTQVLGEADEQGVQIFAESFTPKNFPFYEHLGFEQVKTIKEPVTGSSYTILARTPVNGFTN